MADRPKEYRGLAARCLALARTTTDPNTRVALIDMARSLHDQASQVPLDVNALTREGQHAQHQLLALLAPRAVASWSP
jgi:hypothetical protein